MRILLVGAGLANASFIHFFRKASLCHQLKPKFTVIDRRPWIGGNCYTHSDHQTGATVHAYGPHIFNTDSQRAWSFMCSYLDMQPFVNRVKAMAPSGVYTLPINLHTINQFYGKKLSPHEAATFIDTIRSPHRRERPSNFEEAMLGHIGRELYEEFIYGYTLKQWGREPSELPATIATRLPFRLDYDDNYYNKKYQGIPANGYTELFEKIMHNDDVEISLDTAYEGSLSNDFDLTLYSGPIDEYFGFADGRLSYRTVYWERRLSEGSYQGNAVVNYTDPGVPHTRINEPRYFEPWKQAQSAQSVYFVEYSKETGANDEPFYPIRSSTDMELLAKYQARAKHGSHAADTRVIFHGRLGSYRYLDMDRIIDEAADLADSVAASSR